MIGNMQQILQMLSSGIHRQSRIGQINKIKSKKLQIFNTHQQYQNLPQQIKKIYAAIFYQIYDTNGKNQPIQLHKVLDFQKIHTKMPICNKRLSIRQLTFRCYDCMTHQASVICKNCFQKGDHKGHRYNQMQSGGGNCDCGNPDAIKPQGFCCDHQGKADIVIIDQNQQNHFLKIFLTLFQWIFRMHQQHYNKPADDLAQIVASYLMEYNQQSLYYNTLTFKLLYHPRLSNKDQIIMNKVLECGIKCVNFAKKMTNLFFTMFSLDVFKYQLIVSYCKAYNNLLNFQKSKFKDLYIQLFANNQLVQNLVTKDKLILKPYSKSYDYMQYMQSLMFISTIKPEVASKFFINLFMQGIILIPQLDLIEQNVQVQNRHIMQIINENLNSQNSYYTVHQSVLSILKKNKVLLQIMIRNYIDAVIDQKYSYDKNKVVAPFHKILSLIILVYLNGDLQSFNIKQIQNLFKQQQKIKVLKSCTKSFQLILKCYNQLALTYFQTSYFDSYSNLYIKSGNTIIIYDQLMFKICLNIFEQTQNIELMNQIILKIFELNKQKQINNNTNNQQIIQEQFEQNVMRSQQQNPNHPHYYQQINMNNNILNSNSIQQQWQDMPYDYNQIPSEQFVQEQSQVQQKQPQERKIHKKIHALKRKNQLLKIIIQNCITQRCDIKQCQSLQLDSKTVYLKKQKTITELLNNFNELTAENLKQILKNFLQAKPNVQEQFIKKYLTFDRNRKKFIIKKEIIQKISQEKLIIQLYPSLKKIGDIFTVQNKKDQEAYKNFTCSKEATQRLNLFFNPYIIKSLSQYYIQNLQFLNGHQEINDIFFNFYQLMKILKHLKGQANSQQIQIFFNKINKLAQKEQFIFLNNKLKQKTKEQLQRKKKEQIMKKFNQKKKKKLMQMKSKQQTFDYGQKMQQQEVQSQCIICHEDDKSQGLCFLANCVFSNILQILNKAQGQSLSFSSCFHPIHKKCFLKTSNQYDFIPCPLCKSQSNIMLPFQKQIENIDLIESIYQRIVTIRVILKQQPAQKFNKKIDQYGILSIFKSISFAIGKVLIKNQQIFNEKNQRLYNTVYNLVTTVFRKILTKKEQERQIKGIQDLLDIMKEQANSINVKTSNYYACEYFTLNILYYSLIHQSDKCSDLLCDPLINYINRQDVKKIWHMCSQLVSLPEFKLRQPKQKLQIQIKQMKQVVKFYKPPNTIDQLLQYRDSEEMQCKNGHQVCICLICQIRLCLQCKQIKQHFYQHHCNQGLCFNLVTGGFFYSFQDRLITIPSLYINDFGVQWKPSKSKQGFKFDYVAYQEFTNQILNQSIIKYLLKKYPQLLKRNNVMENFF